MDNNVLLIVWHTSPDPLNAHCSSAEKNPLCSYGYSCGVHFCIPKKLELF